uniref:Peptidyl-prolyl cis-trans isomerase n=1 Tax=Chromera velia CCMP2878 TaxID=1169474 RepID=A0A0G4G3V1_9ALVE|eukprot:Cvel_4154.t1-p1 / transcript=Cvel_4154.t1 / gene=Cvel_4154 / organism=Chromera_velia_CCMP2878 / gene_product=Peptidyl-prolyl cis-trans isomerase slr1251, putative / transcript_product=Peptidyl-prolyl cis-trans isomerase slr1251, putative / location=Cvel_scaffold178:45960-48627(+) / protein_length=233 / sequence_SO=supercontig / SO=protein_coding / is_pseudo=false
MSTKVFLDIDINGHRAAHQRARDFVEATDQRYGWTSKDLSKLGGSEKKRIPEMYEADHEWSQKGRIEVEPAKAERLVVELYDKDAPLCVENFVALCTGEKGKAKGSSKPLCYKGIKFHRVIKGFMAQGGDFVFENGTGGESIWGGKFKDEKGALKRRHDKRGILSMSNTGKNSNGSQFFITFCPRKDLDGKHCVFGEVVSGMEVLDMMEAAGTVGEGTPEVDIVIAECGKVET